LEVQEHTEREAHERAGGRIVHLSFEQHSGRLDDPAHLDHLQRTFNHARKRKALVSTRDLSRYVRPEGFEHRDSEGWRRQATPGDLDRICRMAGGVILATRIPPGWAAVKVHSAVTKSGRKPGRPKKLSRDEEYAILKALGVGSSWSGKITWQISLGDVAKRFRVKKGVVQRLVESPVPERACGQSGLRWKDLVNPARDYLTAWKAGHLEEE
jgi:hypothetical protein